MQLASKYCIYIYILLLFIAPIFSGAKMRIPFSENKSTNWHMQLLRLFLLYGYNSFSFRFTIVRLQFNSVYVRFRYIQCPLERLSPYSIVFWPHNPHGMNRNFQLLFPLDHCRTSIFPGRVVFVLSFCSIHMWQYQKRHLARYECGKYKNAF